MVDRSRQGSNDISDVVALTLSLSVFFALILTVSS